MASSGSVLSCSKCVFLVKDGQVLIAMDFLTRKRHESVTAPVPGRIFDWVVRELPFRAVPVPTQVHRQWTMRVLNPSEYRRALQTISKHDVAKDGEALPYPAVLLRAVPWFEYADKTLHAVWRKEWRTFAYATRQELTLLRDPWPPTLPLSPLAEE